MSKEITVAFFGEAAFHNINWVNYLSSLEGINAIMFYTRGEPQDFAARVSTYPFFEFYSVYNKSKNNQVKEKLEKLFKQHNVDILHFLWGAGDPTWINLLDYPSIITTRGSDILRILEEWRKIGFQFSKAGLRNFLNLRIHKKAYLKAKAITSTSTRQQAKIKEFIPQVEKKLHLVRTGVLLDEFMHSEPPKMDKKQLVIFSPRSMKGLYNQHIILKAFKGFLSKFPNAILRMIDNLPGTEYSNYIQAQIKDLGLSEHIVMLPSLDKQTMHQEYIKSDIVVMVPDTDGTPVSAIESMLSFRPTIMGAYPYDDDLFDRNAVWRLSKTADLELLQALEEVAALSQTTLQERLTKAQNIVIERADRKKEMQKIAALYHKILNF